MTGDLLPVFKSSQQEKVPLQPFRAPAAHRDGVREKEFLRKMSIPLLCLEGVPDLPSTPKDEAGLTRKFET